MPAIVRRDILHWSTFRDLHFLSCSSPVVPEAASEERIKERTSAEGSGKESHCLPASRGAEDRVGGLAEALL